MKTQVWVILCPELNFKIIKQVGFKPRCHLDRLNAQSIATSSVSICLAASYFVSLNYVTQVAQALLARVRMDEMHHLWSRTQTQQKRFI